MIQLLNECVFSCLLNSKYYLLKPRRMRYIKLPRRKQTILIISKAMTGGKFYSAKMGKNFTLNSLVAF